MQPRIPPANKTYTFFLYSHGSGDGTTTTNFGTTFTARWHQTTSTPFLMVFGQAFYQGSHRGRQPAGHGKGQILQVTDTLFDAALV
jgi:hypothetical protein